MASLGDFAGLLEPHPSLLGLSLAIFIVFLVLRGRILSIFKCFGVRLYSSAPSGLPEKHRFFRYLAWMPLRLHLGPYLEPLGNPLGRSWFSLGRLLDALGALLGALGALLGCSWVLLGGLGPLLGISWPLLRLSWALLRRSWVALGSLLGALAALLGRFWLHLGTLGRSF